MFEIERRETQIKLKMNVHVVLLTKKLPSSETIKRIQSDIRLPHVYMYQIAPELTANDEKDVLSLELHNFFLIRHPISTIFAPLWAVCPITYVPLQQLAHNDEWTVFITDASNIDDLDYHLHMSSFTHKRSAALTDDIDTLIENAILDVQAIRGERSERTNVTNPIRSPLILSQWSDVPEMPQHAIEVIRHGIRHLKVFLASGWHEPHPGPVPGTFEYKTGPIPGWAIQTGSHWLTRFFDVYKVYPYYCREDHKMESYTDDLVEKGMLEPIHKTHPIIPRYNLLEIVEAGKFRFMMLEGTLKILVAILMAFKRLTPDMVRQHGSWTSLALWESIIF